MIKAGNRAEIDHHPKNQTVNTYHGVKRFWACTHGCEENKWECADVYGSVTMNNFVSLHM
jgi:hypothetical protein